MQYWPKIFLITQLVLNHKNIRKILLLCIVFIF